MEVPYNLIWVVRPLTHCLLSNGPVTSRQVELGVRGTRLAWFRVDLGYCATSGCWYGLLEGLENILEEAGWDLAQVRSFHLGNRVLATGAWLGEEGDLMTWEKLVEVSHGLGDAPVGPAPDEAAVRALPVLPETWELGVRVARWITDETDEPMLSYVAVVLDGDMSIRHFNLKAGLPQETAELAALIYEAAARPRAPVPPGRPLRLVLGDEALAQALAVRLAGTDIAVEVGATVQVDAVLEHMLTEMRETEPPAYFSEYDVADVRAFFRAAARFYRARPWLRFDGTKYLAFRVGDAPWRYANIMGQAGAEMGLSIFDDWLQLCRFIHNQPFFSLELTREEQLRPLRAAGALEGVTLAPLHALHPEDAHLVLRLGVQPLHEGEYPIPHRYVPDAMERPQLPLAHYRALMEALADALAARRSGEVSTLRRTLSVDGEEVRLVYPANAREEFEAGAGAFRLVVEGRRAARQGSDPLPPGDRLEIDAPGDARLDDVAHAIKRACNKALWVDGFLDGEDFLWLNSLGRVATTPRVAHLTSMRDLQVSFPDNRTHPFRVVRQNGAAPAGIQVRLIRHDGA